MPPNSHTVYQRKMHESKLLQQKLDAGKTAAATTIDAVNSTVAADPDRADCGLTLEW
jgi:hypothetical protein